MDRWSGLVSRALPRVSVQEDAVSGGEPMMRSRFTEANPACRAAVTAWTIWAGVWRRPK